MDFIRALDILAAHLLQKENASEPSKENDFDTSETFTPVITGPSTRIEEDEDGEFNEQERNQKITACRVVTEQICAPSLRNTSADFPRFLSVAVSSIIHIQGDKDINVRIVGEECLNKVIKELIDIYPDRILFELYKVIKRGRSCGRAQRASLTKFSEICHYIKPIKCRKYITSLLLPIAEIIAHGGEMIQESLATGMENICSTLIYHLKEKEVNHLIELFLKNMESESAPIRRSATKAVKSICKYSPFASFDFVILSFQNVLQLSKEKEVKESSEKNFHYLLGVLHCCLHLVKLSHVELGTKFSSSRHPAIHHTDFFNSLISYCIKHPDHNVVGAALELLNQLLSSYGKFFPVWGGLAQANSQMRNFLDLLFPLINEESVRTSTKAVALSCFSHIARRYPDTFLSLFKTTPLIDFSKTLFEHVDPLIRGSVSLLLGYFVAGYFYENKKHINLFNTDINLDAILELILKGLRDSSSVTVKMACKSLGKCLKAFSNLQLCQLFPENGTWSLKILQALLSTIKEDAYWLVQVEALAALSKCDYRVVYCLERGTKEMVSEGYTSFGGIEIIQQRILEFILWHKLGDPDSRVRNQAAAALVSFVPKLCFNLQIERVNTGISISDIRESIDKIFTYRTVQFNISHVVKLLLRAINRSHPVQHTKGCYYTLLLLCKEYSNQFPHLYGKNIQHNLMNSYLADIIPLALDRVACFPSLSTDLDVHIHIVTMLGYLCKGANTQVSFFKYSTSILKHLKNIIFVITSVVQKKPLPISRDKETSAISGTSPFGQFVDPVFLKLYERVTAARVNSQASVSINSTDDKFNQLLSASIKSLSILIKEMGYQITPFVEEILGYLSVHCDQEPEGVIVCLKELFVSTFSNTSPVNFANFTDTQPKPKQENHEPIYDTLFKSYNPHFTFPVISPFNLKEFSENFNRKKNADVLRLFEPMVTKSIQRYQVTHKVELLQAILDLLSELINYGIHFDKSLSILEYIVSQFESQVFTFPSPPLLMPSIFNFISSLFLASRNIQPGASQTSLLQALKNAKLTTLASYAFTYLNWNQSGVLFYSLRSFIHHLFAINDEESQLRELKDSIFSQLLSRFTFPEASELLTIILVNCKTTQDNMAEIEWKQYSEQIIDKALTILSSKQDRPLIFDTDNLLHYYQLFDWVYISKPEKLFEALIQWESQDSPTVIKSNLIGEKLEQSMLSSIYWLPGYLVLLRITTTIREEVIISSAQIASQKKFGGKSAPEIILSSLFKAIQVVSKYLSCTFNIPPVSLEFFSHLLHLVVQFLSGSPKMSRLIILQNLRNSPQLYQTLIDEITSLIYERGYPEHCVIWTHLLYLMQNDIILLKGIYQINESSQSYNYELVKTNTLVEFCLLSIQRESIPILTKPLISLLLNHLNMPVVAQFLETINKNPENTKLVIEFISDTLPSQITVIQQILLVDLLELLSPSLDTFRFLITFLCKESFVNISEILLEKFFHQNIFYFTFISNKEELMKDIEPLFETFRNSSFGQQLTNIRTEFETFMKSCGKNIDRIELPNPKQDGERVSKRQDHLFDLIIRRFNNKNQMNLSLSTLAILEPECVGSLFNSNQMDLSLLLSFIKTEEAVQFVDRIHQFLQKQIEIVITWQDVSMESWIYLLDLSKSLALFHQKHVFKITSLLLNFVYTGLSFYFKMKSQKNATHLDCNVLLQLVTVILNKSPFSEIDNDLNWLPVLKSCYKLYVTIYQSLEHEKSINLSDLTKDEMLNILISHLNQNKELLRTSLQQAYDSFLLSLANCHFSYVYPTHLLEADYNSIDIRLELLSDPETLLSRVIRSITRVGWQTETQFRQLWKMFEFFLDLKPSNEELESSELGDIQITEQTKCLTVAGLTTMILQAGLEKKITYDVGGYNHFPREKELPFLQSDHGQKLIQMQTIIDSAIYSAQKQRLIFDSGTHPVPIIERKLEELYKGLSPYHAHSERFPSFVWPQGYYAGQLSISQLRRNALKKYSWKSIDISELIGGILTKFQKIAENGRSQHLLFHQILKSIVLLSDLFNATQFEWMLDTFQKIYSVSEIIEDSLTLQYLTLGICKAAAIVQLVKIPQPPIMIKILKIALENPESCIQLAALNGVLYLLESEYKILLPLLSQLFKYLSSILSVTSLPAQLKAHALSVSFLLIEYYPKESSEVNFVTPTLQSAMSQIVTRETSIMILNTICKGFGRLLVSFSLPLSDHESICSFASKKIKSLQKFPVSNSIHSLLALGLLVTCMYTGRQEPVQPQNSNERPLAYIENMERMQMIFSKVYRKGFPHEVEALITIIPTLLLDLFSIEQALSMILREFIKQLNDSGYPELMALVIMKTFEITRKLKAQEQIYHWIGLCLNNFTQISSSLYCLWSLTCLFLSASTNVKLQRLFYDVASNLQLDEELFLESGLAYFKELNLSLKEEFLKTFTEAKQVLSFFKLATLCENYLANNSSELPSPPVQQ